MTIQMASQRMIQMPILVKKRPAVTLGAWQVQPRR
jgi:hypothetical protein